MKLIIKYKMYIYIYNYISELVDNYQIDFYMSYVQHKVLEAIHTV